MNDDNDDFKYSAENFEYNFYGNILHFYLFHLKEVQ